MKSAKLSTTVAILASLSLAGGALAAGEYGKTEQKSESSSQMQQSGQSGKQAKITNANDVKDFKVQSSQGEKIGKVDKVVLDLEQGRVGYVIVSAAEGQDKYIIPWSALKAQPDQKILTLNMSPDRLKQAPKGDIQNVQDRTQAQKIHQFYGVSPYWEQSGSQPSGMQQQPSGMHQPGGSMERGSMQDQQKTRPGM